MKWRSLQEAGENTDIRPLRDIFAERKELIAKYVPPETQAVHARAIADLTQKHLTENILGVGARIPEFQLPDHDGRSVSSSALLAKGRLVLQFVRGRWCPFCVAQLEAMNLIVPEIEQSGTQHRLRFPLLSDAGNKIARQFGLTYRVPDEQKAVYQRAFVNLPLVNGDTSWELPIPATYIIASDGTVVYASANEDYTARPEPTHIVRFLQTLP